MSNMLQKQHEGMASAINVMQNLKDMLGEQTKSARQAIMKSLMSTKMVEGTL